MHYLVLGLIFLGTLLSHPVQAYAACTASEEGQVRHLACPIGQYGVRTQTCTALVWTDVSVTPCPIIQCAGGINIGETVGDSTNCPPNFTAVKATGATNFSKTCLLPPTNTAAGLLYANQTACKPQYTSCYGSGSRILPCPVNTIFPANQQAGQITQKCDGSQYQTVEDSCAPPTCNGQPVGSYRSVKGKGCPAGRKGTLLEICARSGQWEVSLANCGAIVCPGGADPVSGVTWGGAYAGSTASTAACGGWCTTGSVPFPVAPPITRTCSEQGVWLDASSVCPP